MGLETLPFFFFVKTGFGLALGAAGMGLIYLILGLIISAIAESRRW